MKPQRAFLIIICLTFIAAVIDLPQTLPLNLDLPAIKLHWHYALNRPTINTVIFGRSINLNFEIKKGLDLQGGTHVVLKADMADIDATDRLDALEASKSIIGRRVDLFGVSEPVIQTSIIADDYRLIVELPGIKDVNQALDLIGQTAQLEFRALVPEATQAATLADFLPTPLSGKHLKRSQVQFGDKGDPQVGLQFNAEGTGLFADLTQANLHKPLAIFIDGFPLTIPTVSTAITNGQAVISGGFTLDMAKKLSIQLNAGAMPVPIEIIEQKNIGATLGQESIDRSLRAGLIGLCLVMLFMLLSYGFAGFLADLALIIYGLITLSLYKLIPVTLTLPGLAGFILSVGMAVDSNILIFERMKEELKQGKPWQTAMELGFGRAWDSIKDANVATLITAFILFNPLNWSFLNTSGLVRGFALTLSLGIGISLFTGIVVTRTLMRLFYRPRAAFNHQSNTA